MLDASVSGAACAAASADADLASTGWKRAHRTDVEVNPRLNALVADRFDAARREAAAADAVYDSADHEASASAWDSRARSKSFWRYKECRRPAVFCIARESLQRRTLLWCRGFVKRAQFPLGVTNVPEGGLWMETHNLIWDAPTIPGIRREPLADHREEKARWLLRVGLRWIGSDIGGSIPDSGCVLWQPSDTKPSAGLIPNTGHFPAAKDSHGYGPLWGDDVHRFCTS